ncbi:MAG: NCS2 family permease [Candidatus Marinimicrobia bacterium]|nr:NCS2 family permease [Candidatus Neomarinimicrobiota bacterium]MCF7827519.1 NCS2 family permease [Candidatus Neomarinimicrobiota bacterium]MCF7881619.1 NCS2 family permease [Candidatus Neomarinimicrobiota bacterium]
MDKYFRLKENNTNVRTEVIAGITTFLATMYIIVVNPSIISDTGMPFNGVLTATVLVSAFASIMMGIYAKNPIVIAPGMGLNAYFTYSVVIGMDVPWETALGAVFWSGIIFLLLSIFNVRTYIVKAIPKQIRYGVAAGIGLFITLIGFINAGFVTANESTVVGMGPLNAITITFIIGLLVTAVLIVRRVKAAIILGITITTLIAIPIGRIYGDASAVNYGVPTLVTWKGLFAMPDFSLFFAMDFIESLKLALWPVVFAFLFTDMFDSLSTFIGVAEAAKLLDENGEPRNVKESLVTDGFATTISGLFGTSSGTAYIESATGIEEGGRSGLTAVVAGLLFLPFMFFSPLLSIVPDIATAPALVLVGVFMIRPVRQINWQQFDDAIPAFLALVLIPLTYSITQGIIWGFLSWTVIKLAQGKTEEVTPMLLVIDAFAILALIV